MKRLYLLLICLGVKYVCSRQRVLQPDFDGDDFVGINDILGVLSTFGTIVAAGFRMHLPWIP